MTASQPHRAPAPRPEPPSAVQELGAIEDRSAVEDRSAADDPNAPLGRRAFWESEGVPAGLISLVFHTALLILLMLWQFSSQPSGLLVTFSQAQRSDGPSQRLDQLLLPEEPELGLLPADDTAAPLEIPDAGYSATVAAIAAPTLDLRSDLPPSQQDIAGRKTLAEMLSASSPQTGSELRLAVLPSGGIAPRNAASRAQLGALYGATPESENAVEMALAWLAQHQQRNGSWSFDLTLDPCRGQCTHSRRAGESATPSTAATGLALLAFLGAGHTHREGDYTETVRRGIYYLRDEARSAQFGLDLQAGSMYGHGIATLALTEALAIDHYNQQEDAELRELVEDLILFTSVAQHPRGGWRYVPGSPGDMTVSAWQILSLISARYSNVPLRTTTLPAAKEFLLSLSTNDPYLYAFGYTSARPQPRTTAIGLCMLMYFGESPSSPAYANALQGMAVRGPKLVDVYHDYYATMALHNARHRLWDRWHEPLRDHLVRTQGKTGHERGSWHFTDPHGDVGGRLYTTAMAAMILEVYYRHLPLYQDRDEFQLR